MVSLKHHVRKINIPQLVFKIMKVVSLKMVTNMYGDLRSECVSEYP